MKKTFLKTSLFFLFSFLLLSCTNNEDDNLQNHSSRTVFQDADADYDGNNGGGGSGSCAPNEYDNFSGNINSGQLQGRSVPNISTPIALAVDFYMNYNIQYSKNSQGEYVITKNFSEALTNCSSVGQRTITYNSRNAYISGSYLYVVTNFTVKYTVPNPDPTATSSSISYNILYTKTKTFPLQ